MLSSAALKTEASKKGEDNSTSTQEQWHRVHALLKSNPSLATSKMLCMVLKRSPPFGMVQFILTSNPKAADVPKHGPTPLQVAVQHLCSADIISVLIETCPLALIATNPGSTLDPLSYAKRFRSKETDLIELLSRPVCRWINKKVGEDCQLQNRDDNDKASAGEDDGSKSGNDHDDDSKTGNTSCSSKNQDEQGETDVGGNSMDGVKSASEATLRVSNKSSERSTVLPSEIRVGVQRATTQMTASLTANARATMSSKRFMDGIPAMPYHEFLPRLSPKRGPSLERQRRQDRDELENVKRICAVVAKGHKQLSSQIKRDVPAWLETKTQELGQMVCAAFDAKEQAMNEYVRRFEEQMTSGMNECLKQMRDLSILTHEMKACETSTRARLSQLLDQMNLREWDEAPLTTIVGFHNNASQRTFTTSSSSVVSSLPTYDIVRPVTVGPRKALKPGVMPFVFRSPAFEISQTETDDEVRSLLSENDVIREKRYLWMVKRFLAIPSWVFALKAVVCLGQ